MNSTELRVAADDAAASYDSLPYVSLPFVQMQPARIAALAQFFGLTPEAVEKARVLEIGCASGGHLIPLAHQFPDAEFVGIDPSHRQIVDGQNRAAAFGLKNLDLRPIGIEGLKPEDGKFDYILCHGVYSWVPDPVREAILDAIQNYLTPNGIAYVSYNVLPGWTMRQAVRETLLITTGQDADLNIRVKKARQMIEFLNRSTNEDTIWGKIWRQEAEELEAARDDYIGHEFLESENSPCTFIEFIGEADRFQLTYLCEVEIFTMIPESGDTDVARELRELTENRLYAVEQMLDVVNGRTFRQTLLVHKDKLAHINRNLTPERLAPYNFVSNGEISRKRGEAKGSIAWENEGGSYYESNDKAVIRAIDQLIDTMPSSVSLQDLTSQLDLKDQAPLLEALFVMFTVGLIDISVKPIMALNKVGQRPKIFEIARVDAKNKLKSTASLLHDIVDLDEDDWSVLPYCDGTMTIAEIYAAVSAQTQSANSKTNPKKLVDSVLESAAQNGLLVSN